MLLFSRLRRRNARRHAGGCGVLAHEMLAPLVVTAPLPLGLTAATRAVAQPPSKLRWGSPPAHARCGTQAKAPARDTPTPADTPGTGPCSPPAAATDAAWQMGHGPTTAHTNTDMVTKSASSSVARPAAARGGAPASPRPRGRQARPAAEAPPGCGSGAMTGTRQRPT